VLDETENQLGVTTAADVLTLTIDCGTQSDVVVTITEDADRGGIVGDNLGVVTVSGNTISCATPCPGDVASGVAGQTDNQISSSDVIALLVAIRDQGVNGVVDPIPAGLEAGDVASGTAGYRDNKISSSDVIALLVQIRDNGVSGVAPCLPSVPAL
jgi:hypothetical protein